tara:strand:+ start:2412 stop:2921 length:510 start_codon:yes stop_codon:yes gene_type:complete
MSANEFWTNNDGLNVRFGLEKGTAAKMGRLSTMGDKGELVVDFGFADISNTDSVVGTHPLAGIPSGSFIESATLYVKTAFAGSSSTLNIGLWNDDGDGTFSVNDADGIDAAIAVAAIDAIDDKIACNGALVGTTPAGTGDRALYVSVQWGTALFSAGAARLVIVYSKNV